MLKYNRKKWRFPVLISTPTEGWVRYEWAHCRYGQVIPINWAAQGFDLNYSAIGYSIDDAYNLITHQAIKVGVEWLLLVEDDVLLPGDCFVKMGRYMEERKYPVVSGLYFTKGVPSEPLLFRGRGNGAYKHWKWGEKVMCDGLPMGCLLIHMSILRWMSDHSEQYRVPTGEQVAKVFHTPRKVSFDILTWTSQRQEGTQDLYFFDRVIDEKILEKTGWDELAGEEFPFLCDTGIFCKHIDRGTGKMFPLKMEA